MSSKFRTQLGAFAGLLTLAVFVGCGSKTTNLTPSPNEKTLKNMPDW